MTETRAAPKVSVLMTVYNGEDYLADAVSSVLGQDFADFELLVVDDASTDRSPQLLQAFAAHDPRVRVVRRDENAGAVEASNAGLAQVRGELLARLDADDVCEPGRVSLQVAAFDAKPGLVLLGTAFDYIDPAGRRIGSNDPPLENEALQAALHTHNPFCHSSTMMRSAAVRRLGGYRQLLNRYALDYDLILRLAEVGEIANLPERLVRYRVHATQISAQKLEQQVQSAQVYRALARQRRAGFAEDLPRALAEMQASSGLVRDAVVRGSLFWADLLDGFDPAQARSLRERMLRTAPFHPRVLRMLLVQAKRAVWRRTFA